MKKILFCLMLMSLGLQAQMLNGYNMAFAMKSMLSIPDGTQKMADMLNADSPVDVLRIPAGTLSFQSDISAPFDGDPLTNRYTLVPNPKNYLYDYARFVDKLNHKPKTIVCLNVYRHCKNKSLDGAENTLLYLQEAVRLLGADNIYAVELGNELYMHSECNGITGALRTTNRNNFNAAVQRYKEYCNWFIPRIKAMCPNAIICVPVESCLSERGNEWSKAVTSIVGVTGITPHFYCKTVSEVEADVVNKTSIKVKVGLRKVMHSLIPKFKVVSTEYNYSFGAYGDEDMGVFGTQLQYDVIYAIRRLGAKLGFSAMCFHSMLQESYTKVYGQYATKDGAIIKRLSIW